MIAPAGMGLIAKFIGISYVFSPMIFLFIFSLLIRIPSVFFFGDTNLENEWSIIVNNLVNYNEFSFLRFDDFFVPNVLMPPLYAFYLYFFKIRHFTQVAIQ